MRCSGTKPEKGPSRLGLGLRVQGFGGLGLRVEGFGGLGFRVLQIRGSVVFIL